MPVESPVSERLTVGRLLLLTFATGIVDAVSVLVLGHVFVANMTGNVIFLGFWFVPHPVVDMTAALVAFVELRGGRGARGPLARHLDNEVRRWLTVALGVEVVVLVALSILAGTGVLDYHDNTKLILIAGLAVTFGSQNATARQFGIQELSTTVLTSTIVGIGFDSRLAGGTGHREKLRYSVVVTMCAGATGRRDHDTVHGRAGDRARRGRGGCGRRDLRVRPTRPGCDRGLVSPLCHQYSSPVQAVESASRSSSTWPPVAGT